MIDMYTNRFQTIAGKEIPGIGAIKTNLARLLRSIDLVGWSTNEESGRLDRRAFTRYATGSVNIFSRRERKEAETSSVYTLIDASGSMDLGSRINLAQEVVIHLARLLEKCHARHKVCAFRSGYVDSIGESARFFNIKDWNESVNRSAPKLGYLNELTGGGTPDFTAMSHALQDVAAQGTTRKVLFVITDAEGFSDEGVKRIEAQAEMFGVTVIVIGIHSNVSVFKNSCSVRDLKELASNAFATLVRNVSKHANA
jgi:uncharacterized protein with von Willebrand factor type A (vWA) domain